jgi:hypothetical protein
MSKRLEAWVFNVCAVNQGKKVIEAAGKNQAFRQ